MEQPEGLAHTPSFNKLRNLYKLASHWQLLSWDIMQHRTSSAQKIKKQWLVTSVDSMCDFVDLILFISHPGS